MSNKLLYQGAEAKIFLDNQRILKQRIKKSYRHPTLDNQIRTKRTKSEAKLLSKALEAGVSVPKVIQERHTINPHTNEPIYDFSSLIIEHIKGDRLSETLNSYPETKQFKVMEELGKETAKLHQNNIIHGDLTTSNVILTTNSPQAEQVNKKQKGVTKSFPKNNQTEGLVYIIDFGLGFISNKIEDKAVDLHLIKQALEAKHYQNHEKLFSHFKEGYLWSDSKKVLERLEAVEKRGRYKH